MINSNTSFGKLKDVIVGRELELTIRISDITFRTFYKESLKQTVYDEPIKSYNVRLDLIEQRNKELDDLSDTLRQYGINVYRPDTIKKIIKFKTPTFDSVLSSASNVRDVSIVYQNKIIETPVFVRNRYFENISLYNIYNKFYNNGKGGQWIKAPHTSLVEDRMDLEDWTVTRDYDNFDSSLYDMAIDGAQFLRIGRDVIVNISSYNQYLGYKWIESLYPDSTFHPMYGLADNHIDGVLCCLCEGKFLVDPKYPNIKEYIPNKFKNWDLLFPDDLTKNIDIKGMTDIDVRLASSRGMDINVLSIDENTVVVNNRALGVKEILSKNGFNVIEIELNHGEIFGGGIHCSTLDLNREDEYIYY